MDRILNLADPLNCLDPALVGRKAYSLAYALSNKFPVPRSAVVSAGIFREFLDAAIENVDGLLSECAHNGNRRDEILEGIRIRIMEQPLAPSTARMIYDAFSALDSQYVAVRSSATIEDSASRSFAGQYESFLGVTGKNLLMSVKACWASVFGARAFRYLGRQRDFGNMAVLIQEMIDADASGVCFGLNPVTGDRNEIIIEAVLGLGEILVQGAVIPDHYLIEKNRLEAEDRNLQVHSQDKMIVLNTADGGCVLRQIDDEATRRKQKLSKEEIIEIARCAVETEKCYQAPMDIEWALKDGKLYLLQARPITGF